MPAIIRRDCDYYTEFNQGDENPTTQGGRWLNGATDFLDWTDWTTNGGKTYGLQSAAIPPYRDSVLVFVPYHGLGTVNAEIEAQIGIDEVARASWSGNHELELLFCINARRNYIRLYEALFSTSAGTTYTEQVRWPGPVGTAGTDFKSLKFSGTFNQMSDKAYIKAIKQGGLITSYYKTQFGSYSQVLQSDILADSGDGVVLTPGYCGLGWWKNGVANNPDYWIRNVRIRYLP